MAANNILGTSSPEAMAWHREVMVQLIRGKVDESPGSFEQIAYIDTKQEQARKSLTTYLKNNRERMDCPTHQSVARRPDVPGEISAE